MGILEIATTIDPEQGTEILTWFSRHEISSIVFAIDEAGILARHQPGRVSSFSILISAAAAIKRLDPAGLICLVFADTNPSVGGFTPKDGPAIHPPFCTLSFMDNLCMDYLREAMTTRNWFEFVRNRDENGDFDLLTLGRPMWTKHRQSLASMGVDRRERALELVKMALGETDVSMLAAIMSRVFVNTALDSNMCDQLVASHMATCEGIDQAKGIILTSYRSEPALAAAASECMDSDRHLLALQSWMSKITVDIGARGEIAAQLILIRAYDAAARKLGRESLPSSITVEEFLEALYCDEVRDACLSGVDQAGDSFGRERLEVGLVRGAMQRPSPGQLGFAISIALPDGTISGMGG